MYLRYYFDKTIHLSKSLMMFFYIFFLLISVNVINSETCDSYRCPHPPRYEPFVPAPPGNTPRCAKPRQTFCETPDQYPQQLIRYLVDKCSFNFATVLRDESEFNFNSYRRKPEYHKGYDNQRQYFSQPVTFLRPTYPFVGHSPVIYGSPSNKTANEGYNYSPPPRNSKNPLLLESRSKFERSTSFATFYQHPDWWTTSKQRGRKKRQSSSDTISLCETRTQYIAPRAALNNRGNWMYIVNIADSKEKHSQLVKSEICTSTQCDGICSLPVGYSSKCEQQYVQKRLVALEGTGDRLYTDVFWFPHGCSCQILTSF